MPARGLTGRDKARPWLHTPVQGGAGAVGIVQFELASRLQASDHGTDALQRCTTLGTIKWRAVVVIAWKEAGRANSPRRCPGRW